MIENIVYKMAVIVFSDNESMQKWYNFITFHWFSAYETKVI